MEHKKVYRMAALNNLLINLIASLILIVVGYFLRVYYEKKQSQSKYDFLHFQSLNKKLKSCMKMLEAFDPTLGISFIEELNTKIKDFTSDLDIELLSNRKAHESAINMRKKLELITDTVFDLNQISKVTKPDQYQEKTLITNYNRYFKEFKQEYVNFCKIMQSNTIPN